jgi:hypothetical protein
MKRLPKARRATLDEASPEQAAPCSLRQRTASTDSLYDILRIKILDSELLPGNRSWR